MKSQRETLRSYLKLLGHDLARMEQLHTEAAARGLDADEVAEWIDRFRAWRGAVDHLERHWDDPRADQTFRLSAVGRALERLRKEQTGHE